MSSIAFPKIRGQLSREQFLTLLLVAIVQQCDGEVHIPGRVLDTLDDSVKLVVDWDPDSQQAILRSGSSSLVIAEVRGAGWRPSPTLAQPLAVGQVASPDATKHAVADEARIVDYIQKAWQRERMNEWKSQGADILSKMPEPTR